eukprot:838562_1
MFLERESAAFRIYIAVGSSPVPMPFELPLGLMKIALDNLPEQLTDALVDGANGAGRAQIFAAYNHHTGRVSRSRSLGQYGSGSSRLRRKPVLVAFLYSGIYWEFRWSVRAWV